MNELERRVLQKIGENVDSPDVFTDDSTGMAQIRDSINDAIEEIAMLTGCVKDKYQLALRANCSFYRLTTNRGSIAYITDAWLVSQRRRLEQSDLTRMTRINPRWLYDGGSPSSYIPIGFDMVAIWPTSSSDDDIVEFNYVSIPERYKEDTDRIRLRETYKTAPVHYAVSEYWASRGDAKSAVTEFQKYLEILGLSTAYPYGSDKFYTMASKKEQFPKYSG